MRTSNNDEPEWRLRRRAPTGSPLRSPPRSAACAPWPVDGDPPGSRTRGSMAPVDRAGSASIVPPSSRSLMTIVERPPDLSSSECGSRGAASRRFLTGYDASGRSSSPITITSGWTGLVQRRRSRIDCGPTRLGLAGRRRLGALRGCRSRRRRRRRPRRSVQPIELVGSAQRAVSRWPSTVSSPWRRPCDRRVRASRSMPDRRKSIASTSSSENAASSSSSTTSGTSSGAARLCRRPVRRRRLRLVSHVTSPRRRRRLDVGEADQPHFGAQHRTRSPRRHGRGPRR